MKAVEARGLLDPPKHPDNITTHAKWLGGVGAGSWFLVEAHLLDDNLYHIERFDPKGVLECKGVFKLLSGTFDVNAAFEIDYPSHCEKCTIKQGGQILVFIKYSVEECT